MKLKRFLTGVLSAVMALSVCALPAAADDTTTGAATTTYTSTIDTSKKGSITIHKYLMETIGSAKDPNNGEEIDTTNKKVFPEGTKAASGAEFTIYQVMSKDDLIKYYNGELEKYKDSTPAYTDFVEKENEDGPYKIKKGVTVNDSTGTSETTDTDGVAKFKDLELGLYVVIETKTPPAVTKAVTPFLVSVPMTKVETDAERKKTATEWLYDIHVYPKNSTATGSVTLVKKGVIGNDTDKATPLAGVEFKLEHLKDGQDETKDANWEQIKNGNENYFTTASENGSVTINGLNPGKYRFTEIGYATGSENKFIINNGAKYVFEVKAEVKAGENSTVTVSKPESAENSGDYKADGNTVTVYNYAPDVDKQVVNRTDGKTYQEAADYAVGDKIPYRIAVTIPTNIAKLKTFYLTDTPENLDDDTRTIGFYSDSDCKARITKSLVKESDGITSTSATKGTGFKIDFDLAKLKEYAGKTIYITYEATLKKSAVTTTVGNNNKVDLTYSNKVNPDSETEDRNHIEDTTVVYTFQIDITKVGKDGNTETPLDGVTFKLYEQIEHQTAVVGNVLSDDAAKALGFKNTKDFSYKEVATDTTKDGGKLTFTGLSNSKTATTGASRYWLVETKTKDGYNLLGAPVEAKLDIVYKTTWTEKNEFDNGVLVKRSHDANTETFTTPTDGSPTNGGMESGKNGIGSKSINVVNKKGFQLPVTGGFGTLLFSGIGVLLVLAGVAVLFSMKKKNDRA